MRQLIERWLRGRRRLMVMLLLLGFLVATAIGSGGLFLLYWLFVSLSSGVLGAAGILSHSGGPIQLWQLHCMAALWLLFLFSLSYWRRVRSDDSVRLFDLVSWHLVVEHCRGPRLSLIRGGSALSLLADVVLLSPRLMVLAFRCLGLIRSWVFLRPAVLADVLTFLLEQAERTEPVEWHHFEHLFWLCPLDRLMKNLLLLDGIVIDHNEIDLRPTFRQSLLHLKSKTQ